MGTKLLLFSAHVTSHGDGFTACGFLTLKTGLITSAVAAGATYLVIMAQFHEG